jgi:hypothetical protein
MKCRSSGFLLLAALMLAIGTAGASPVVYRVTTVADGKLGRSLFTDAVVTVSIYSDTRAVIKRNVQGATVYENHAGRATVTVTEPGKRPLIAHIAQGRLFVRYDITNGIASVGSEAVGPFYPFVIGCNDYPTCSQGEAYLDGDDGISDAIPAVLAGLSVAPQLAVQESPATVALPASLSSPTHLDGFVLDCAVYDAQDNCSGPPAKAIPTVEGGAFYVVDPFFQDATAQFLVMADSEKDD